jgi:colanic acid biosynthesis glycosyl transferase WcaI
VARNRREQSDNIDLVNATKSKTVTRPRVLFINRSYWPDVEATGQLLTELCEDLADDFDVTVVCGRARKVVDDVPPRAEMLRERNRVKIRRVRHTHFDKASFVGRIANMLTFQLAASWSSITAPRPDIVVVETDPPFLCLMGYVLQLLRRARLVCYLQDIYPDVAVALGKLKPGWIARSLRAMFFHVYRRSDAVVVLSRDMRELLVAGGVPAQIVQIVPNWIDTTAVCPIKQNNRFRHEHDLEDKFVVMYSGNMGMSQNLSQVLEAAELLAGRVEIVFAMVGDGADRRNLEKMASERRLSNVRFFGYQPKAELATSLSAADVHLVILQPHICRLLMPSKLYGALASGTPVVAITAAGCELAEVVREHNLGQVVSDGTTRGVADAIAAMADQRDELPAQGERAREYALDNCTRGSSVARMRTLLRGILGQEAKPTATARLAETATAGR